MRWDKFLLARNEAEQIVPAHFFFLIAPSRILQELLWHDAPQELVVCVREVEQRKVRHGREPEVTLQ